MPWPVRVFVVAVLILFGVLLVGGSHAVEWMTADKRFVKVKECRELIEYHDPGLWCYAEDGRGIAGADQEDLGQRIEVVYVQQPPGAPGHSDAGVYTWSDSQTGTLVAGAVVIVVALIVLVWPGVETLRRRHKASA